MNEAEDVEADEEELKKRERMEQDFEIGGIIVDECVPYSLEYYLGVKADGEGDGDDDDEDDDDDDDDKEDEEEEAPAKKNKSKGKPEKGGAAAAKGASGKPGDKPECPQQ